MAALWINTIAWKTLRISSQISCWIGNILPYRVWISRRFKRWQKEIVLNCNSIEWKSTTKLKKFGIRKVNQASFRRYFSPWKEFVPSKYLKGRDFRRFREFEANMRNWTPTKNIFGYILKWRKSHFHSKAFINILEILSISLSILS